MARLILALDFTDPRTTPAHRMAEAVLHGHFPKVKIAQAHWADDVASVQELVADEEDE